MPFVITNPNPTDSFIRLVFDRNIFTAYFRQESCGLSTIGIDEMKDDAIRSEYFTETLLHAMRQQPALVRSHPTSIKNDLDSRHHHYTESERKMYHMHVGFSININHPKAIEAILKAIEQAQAIMEKKWILRKEKYDFHFSTPFCSTKLISDIDAMLQNIKSNSNRMKQIAQSSLCFWVRENQLEEKRCEAISEGIPTGDMINKQIDIILRQTELNRLNRETIKSSHSLFSSIDPGCILLFIITIFLLKKLFPAFTRQHQNFRG